MKLYDTVIWDLDGTLIDTSQGVIKAVQHTINKLSLPLLPQNIIEKFVGPPIHDSFSRYYDLDEDRVQKAANIFREYYKSECLFEAVVYDGIIECLNCLKESGLGVAVATYKSHDNAVELLNFLEISRYCDCIFGADNENKLTKADIINMCITSTQSICRERVVLIGDSIYDAIGAENAGINFIGVTYGFGFRTVADVLKYKNIGYAESVKELFSLLL